MLAYRFGAITVRATGMPGRAMREDESKQSGDASRIISAQVILRPHSGKRLRADVPITSQNLAEYAPSPEDAAAARAAFRAAGFDAGEVLGISFSITGPLALFERFFGTKLRVDERGAVATVGAEAPAGGLELPLDRLPTALAARVTAVAFTPPADLHGGDGSLLF